MPSVKSLPPFFAHWLAFAGTLAAYIVWVCGVDAVRYGALPQNTALLSEGGVLLYTVAVTAFYTVGLTRLSRRFAQDFSGRGQKMLYGGWLFDMSLFWLFGAYCLLKNYRTDEGSFFASWPLWLVLGVYLLLSTLIHLAFYGRPKE